MWARSHDASVLLRIDDIDRERVRPEFVEDVFLSLEWLGLDWDDGPTSPDDFEANWSQRHRRDLYDGAILNLIERGAVYACRCSRNEWANRPLPQGCPCQERNLPTGAADTVLRLKMLPSVPFDDVWMGPQTPSLSDSNSGTVMRRRDGLPAYQICSVVDDLHFGITHGVRGADLVESTHIQLGVAALLKWDAFRQIQWMHHPLMLQDGHKMSKSAGVQSLAHLRKSGLDRSLVVSVVAAWLGIPATTFAEMAARVDWRQPLFVKNPTT